MQVTRIRHGTDIGALPFLMRYQFVREGDSANYLSPDELHAIVFPPHQLVSNNFNNRDISRNGIV